MSYYDDLLKPYTDKLYPQKTPQQITDEQKIQAYQIFISTKEGIQALNEVNAKFNLWYDENYGVKNSNQSNEVKELKELVLKMASQIESLTTQFK
jgi:flagellar motility protein MotE (MotC chaperone)